MSLIRRNVIPLFFLVAMIGIGLGVLTVGSPFASGQETESCDPGVAISIATTNADGQTVAVVSHGDEIFYRVRLSLPEPDPGDTACNYGGGELTLTLPGTTDEYPDGVVTIPVTLVDDDPDTDADETEDFIVRAGNSFGTDRTPYIVDQNHAVQTDPDDADNTSIELTVRANYSGGSSINPSSGDLLPAEVSAIATSVVRMSPPSVAITVSPSTIMDADNPDVQSVLQGQEAMFDIVVTNTGGFELSDIAVMTLADAEVDEVRVEDCERAAGSFDPLAVGDSIRAYQCGTTTEASFNLRAQVTANATAVSTTGDAVSIQVSGEDTSNVLFGTVEVDITITAAQSVVRYEDDEEAQEGSFTIAVSTPTATNLENVTVTVTVAGPGEGESSEAEACFRDFGDVPAGADQKQAELAGYSCMAKMFAGVNTITATVQGTIPGTEIVLTASDDTEVEAIIPGLTVSLTPQVQTVRKGESATITVTVTNGATDLTGVSVIDPDPNNEDSLDITNCVWGPEDDAISLSELGNFGADEQVVINCVTAELTEETSYEAVAIGTAPDNTTEPSEVATATVNILSPSTDVSVAALDGGTSLIRLVVQTVVVTETNDGDSDLTNVYVDVDATGIGPDLTSKRLTRQSPEFVASHGEGANDDDVLNPGETWEWRVVMVGVAGNVVLLDADATGMQVTASGYGTDELDGEVNPETDADEIETQTFPFIVN